MMEFATVRVELFEQYAVLTINRPTALNALSKAVIADLAQAVAALDAKPEVRAVIVTGAGEKAFVAGADIAEMASMPPSEAQAFAEAGGRVGAAIEASPKAWIAAVNGFALGGGCELAMACDFIYASEKASFGQPEVALGVIPGFGGTQRLLRRVGVAKAKELCMTGAQLSAAEALQIGLVDTLVAPDQLMPKAVAVATKIAQNGPLAVAACKRLIQQGQSMSLAEGLRAEAVAFGELFATADQKEGMAAFVARPRRPAAFTGK